MYDKHGITVNVNKDELMKVLKVNRDKHRTEYETAKAGFRKLLERELEKKLEQVRTGKKVELRFKNQRPESHLGDYDEIIGMLELATDEAIELNHSQYRNFVQDKWEWKHSWSLSNAAYLSAAA